MYECVADAYDGTNVPLFSAVVDDTLTPPRYYVSGNVFAAQNSRGGVRWFDEGSSTSTGVVTASLTMRNLQTFNDNLYASYSGPSTLQGIIQLTGAGVGAVNPPWPTNTSVVTYTSLFSGYSGVYTGSANPYFEARAGYAGNAVFESGNPSPRIWMPDCQWGLNLYTRAPENGTYIWTSFWRSPANDTFRFAAGRNNAAGQFCLTLTSCIAPGAIWHFNTVTRAFTRIATAPAGTLYKGVSVAPYDALLEQPSPSNRPSPSSPPSPSPSPVGANAFQSSGTIVVVRSGDAISNTYAEPSLALPTYLDEIDIATGLTVKSIALPTSNSADGSSFACTLGNGYGGGANAFNDQEGQPQLTSDGLRVVLPCYAAAPATQLAGGAQPKTFAVVSATGSVDTTAGGIFSAFQTGSTDANRPHTLRSVASTNGRDLLLSATGSINAGFWLFNRAAKRHILLQQSPAAPQTAWLTSDLRYVTIFGGVAYVSQGTAGNNNAANYGETPRNMQRTPGC